MHDRPARPPTYPETTVADATRPDPRSRFQQSTEPNACLIDGLSWPEWLRKHQQRAAKPPATQASSPEPPEDHPARAAGLAHDMAHPLDDAVVCFFDFSLE